MKKAAYSNKANLVALATVFILLLSCSTDVLTGQTMKETRNVPAFKGVALAFSGDVIITQGSPQSVVIEADKNSLEIIETEVEGNTLVLKTKNMHWRDLGDVTAYITLPEINHLSVSGSGDMICETPITTGEISVEVSGSGSVKISKLISQSIDAVITGSGDINLSGAGNEKSNLKTTITGSGSFSADELAVGDAEITITGSGSVKVNVLEQLETNITGSGSVLYKGNPRVNASSTGSGKTRSVN